MDRRSRRYGTAIDAHQPLEGRCRLARRRLEAFLDARNSLGITTKSTLVLRDFDLLVARTRVTHVKVNFTITTVDPAHWRSIEPGTPPPSQRLADPRRLRNASVPAGVFMAPVLPGITASAEAIEAVAAAAAAHGAGSLWVAPLRLAPHVKDLFFGFVQATFPAPVRRYECSYGGANAPRDYLHGLERRIARITSAYGFADPTSGADRHRGETSSSAYDRRTATAGQLALPISQR